MAERIDGVFVELKADVDASGVIKSEQAITTSAKKIQNEFKKTDAALSGTGKALTRQSKQSQKSAKSMAGMGRSAGMASIQLQQMVGQIQGGVNPMMALSQQGADLGIVLGAPLIGSIVGIGAAIGISLLPGLANSKSAIEQLEEVTVSLSKNFELSSGGVLSFTESLNKLAARSDSLAKFELASNIFEAGDMIKIATNDISKSIINLSQGDFKSFNDVLFESGLSVEQFAEKAGSLAGSLGSVTAKKIMDTEMAISGLGRKLDLTRPQAVELAQALSFFANNKNALGVGALENALSSLGEQTGQSNRKLIDLGDSLIPLFDGVRRGTDITNLLRMAMADLNGQLNSEGEAKSITKAIEMSQVLAQQLAVVRAETEGGANAARRMALAFELSDGASGVLPEHIAVLITEIEKAEAAQISLSETEREEAAKTAKVKADLKAQESARGSNLERIRNEFKTESELLKEKIETELIMLEESLIKDGLKRDEYDELKKKKAEKLAADIGEINKKETDRKKKEEENKKQTTLGNASATFGALSTLMNTESRKLFEIGKAAAIGQAIVDGYAAVSKTMSSVPYPLNIPLAVAQGAASAVQIQGIAKQKFGGAGGGSNTFSGGLPATRTTGGGAGGGGQDRNISIAGIDANSLISGGQLVDTLNQALGDGYTVNFAGG